MSRTWANLRTEISQQLQDTSNATWATAEIDYYIYRALTHIAEYVPYEKIETFKIESRTGTATSTSANNLVDATEAQFLSTDVGKVVFNDDDNTFAIVTSATPTNTLGLSKDIFTSGEDYELYNKGCRSNREINIEDITTWMWIISIEYPTMYNPPKYRNWLRNGNIVGIDIDFTPDDSKNTDSDVEVYVKFAKRHFVCALTQATGAVRSKVNNAGGYAAGSSIMAIDGLTGTEVIKAGQEFTFLTSATAWPASATGQVLEQRGVYTVVEDVTLVAGGGTIKFYPALESAVVNDDDIDFRLTTLTPRLEDILIDWVAAYALMEKAPKGIDAIRLGGRDTWSNYIEAGRQKMAFVLQELRAMQDPTKRMYQRFPTL